MNRAFDWIAASASPWRSRQCHQDRVGHVAQGFFPAIVARAILARASPLRPGKWLAFLATQGDVWDTQWDMFLALLGAIASLLLLSRLHDRQLRRAGHC